MTSTKTSPTRRPRLDPRLRIRIVQIRASNPEHPPSLDAILNQLSKEEWDHLPSRGSVQNVVHQWEQLPEEIKERDLPFQWHELHKARIPWEAAHWVLNCAFVYNFIFTNSLNKILSETNLHLGPFEPFTNRWATWCWRVHLAAPDLNVYVDLLALAEKYVHEEQVNDLLLGHPGMDVEDLDSFLVYRPDLGMSKDEEQNQQDQEPHAWAIERRETYDLAISLGLIKPIKDDPTLTKYASNRPDLWSYEDILAATVWARRRHSIIHKEEKEAEVESKGGK